MTGRVFSGINNIYYVKKDDHVYECRIKGKKLKVEKRYNPIAVGDYVKFEQDSHSDDKGMISEINERSSEFVRLNKKRNMPQTIAANIDYTVCVASPESPPFRPRFIDRVVISSLWGNIKPLIVLNKCDQNISEEALKKLKMYENLGYEIIKTSALTGSGLDELAEFLKGKTCAFVGQSGVGKSTLLNKLFPDLELKTAEVSSKYNRGKHTTNYASMFDMEDCTVIDTPGVREFEISGIDKMDLMNYFPEFEHLISSCSFNQCTHIHEPGCAVLEAFENGKIDCDRYESYMKIFYSLEDQERSYG